MKVKKMLTLLCLVLLTVGVTAQKKSIKKYIEKYEALAIEKAEEHKIPVSIILGVSIVESAAGESAIAKAFRNFFGVKGKNVTSEEKLGYKSAYREFSSAEASFEHFCEMLKKKRFYVKVKSTTDYKQWLKMMNAASYAEAKDKWVADITRAITKYELYKLDQQPLAISF